MLGTKMLKSDFSQEQYAEMANWCNNNHATIEEHTYYYKVVAITATPDTEYQKAVLQQQITGLNLKLAELHGISECAISVDGINEYDVFKDGELVTMNETEFQNYYDELSNKRSDLLQQYKEL